MKLNKPSKWEYLKQSGKRARERNEEQSSNPEEGFRKRGKLLTRKLKNTSNGFYLVAWSIKPHVCEECGMVLKAFSPAYVSHIISKGAFPGLRTDLRNYNLLCLQCHQQWEFGTRSQMKIWTENEKIIETLKREFYDSGKRG